MNLAESLTNPTLLVTALAGVLAFATVVTLAAPVLRRDTLDVRLKSVATRREELRRKSREALSAGRETSIRRRDESVYKNIVERLQLSKLLEDPKVVDKLAEAGFRGPQPVTAFYFFRFCLPFVVALITAFYLFVIARFNLPGMTKFAMIVGAFAAGGRAFCRIWPYASITKRRPPDCQ